MIKPVDLSDIRTSAPQIVLPASLFAVNPAALSGRL
jgi:hypothetical protein